MNRSDWHTQRSLPSLQEYSTGRQRRQAYRVFGGVYKSVGNCLRPTCACAAPMIRGGWGQAAFVIPAQAGIQPCEGSGWVTAHAWTPAFAGVTALLASPQRIPTEIDTEPCFLGKKEHRFWVQDTGEDWCSLSCPGSTGMLSDATYNGRFTLSTLFVLKERAM
jgi:hypothetical protein